MPLRLALKVDVDTDRGTREGVPNLVGDLQAVGAPACFLFSLGPDQTGRAITRVFRPGFFQKVSRTSVVEIYGVRTLLNGTLLPAPHIGRRHEATMRSVREAGFIYLAEGKNKRAWKTLDLATKAEQAVRYNEPPIYPRPIAEAWGQAALRAGERRMAERVFRIALEQTPGSKIPTYGLRQLVTQLPGQPPAAGGN